MRTFKTKEEILNYYYTDPVILTTDRGKRGYFFRVGNYKNYNYHFISKKEIIRILTENVSNERKKKLIALKIINEI